MAQISDNFVRANGVLGANWAAVVANNVEGGPDTFQGNVLINNNGYGPINAFGGDACAIWAGAGAGAFGNDQIASATFKTVAAFTAVLSITAASQSGSNTTYTYTVSSGSVAAAISGGALYVKISGMADAGNNGTFTATTFGAGTFTVVNASGVTRAGQTGTGNCASDSGAGVMVRGSGTTAATLNGYFFHVGPNSFGGGGRIAYYELWKIVNGVGTILFGANDGGLALILPVPGDILTIVAVGTKISAFYNGVQLAQVTDSSVASGTPGITSWSISGSGEYVWSGVNGWPNQPTAPGNNGTTLNNFTASDINLVDTQLASDALTEGVTSTQLASDTFVYANGDLHTANANWVYGVGTFQVSSNKVFSSAAGINSAFRNDITPNPDQYSEVVALITGNSATQNGGPAIRIASGATTFYGIQYSNVAFNIIKEVAGSLTVLASFGSGTAVTGDVVRLQVVGNALTAFKNGVAVTGLINIVDNSIATGKSGIWGAGNATINGYSSWNGGNVFGVPSQFTIESGSFLSDTTAGAYPAGFLSSTSSVYQNIVSWPADQYSEATVSGASIDVGQQTGPAVRVSTGAQTYYQFYPKTGSLATIAKFVAGTGTVLASVPYTFTQGDVFRLEVLGNLLVGRINGVAQVITLDSSIASGKAGFAGENVVGNPATPSGTIKTWSAGSTTALFGISGNAGTPGATVSWTGAASGSVTADGSGNYNTGEVLISGAYTITPSKTGFTFSPTSSAQTIAGADISGVNFTATQVLTVYSVPDCRVPPAGPNASRTVQGTKIYDVQTSSNPAIPPTDSRVAGAPVDSRVSPNIPQNSRAPGTFGPGE